MDKKKILIGLGIAGVVASVTAVVYKTQKDRKYYTKHSSFDDLYDLDNFEDDFEDEI